MDAELSLAALLLKVDVGQVSIEGLGQDFDRLAKVSNVDLIGCRLQHSPCLVHGLIFDSRSVDEFLVFAVDGVVVVLSVALLAELWLVRAGSSLVTRQQILDTSDEV